ncbi:hypothetical protein DL93DRAFT_1651662 [Clavulina sp. PMI_390]|nr:hypothetical protein DL93DRAFT_1651662 [Clavulina sp. PMI_390]
MSEVPRPYPEPTLIPSWNPIPPSHELSIFCHKFWHNRGSRTRNDVVEFCADDQPQAEYPNRLYVRPCYQDIVKFIEADSDIRSGERGGVVITGQPSIGKTFLSWYLIQYRCSQAQPVLFQYYEHRYLFYNHHVYTPAARGTEALLECGIIDILEAGSTLWCIIEMMSLETSPSYLALMRRWYPIQTTSPHPKKDSKWNKGRAWTYYLPPWSRDELVAA